MTIDSNSQKTFFLYCSVQQHGCCDVKWKPSIESKQVNISKRMRPTFSDKGRLPKIFFGHRTCVKNLNVQLFHQYGNVPFNVSTFKCTRTRCKPCPFISNMVKISGPNRCVKINDHITCISVNVIYCITCTLCNYKKIYTGETRRRLAGRFREHLRYVEKKPTHVRQNQLRANLIFLITPTTTWQFAAYPHITGTQKAAKISNKNSSFN